VNNLMLSKANYHSRLINNFEINRTILNQTQHRTFFGGKKNDKEKEDTPSQKDEEIKKEEVEEEKETK
jgi:hypothetical protein